MPDAMVIASAKAVRRNPLRSAVTRVFQPRIRRTPKSVSAAVATIASGGIALAGKNQFSLPV